MTKKEKAELKKHLDALDAAQDFFLDMETKYEGHGEPVDGRPVGPFGDTAETLADILMEDFK